MGIQSSFEDENWKTWKTKTISEQVRDENYKQLLKDEVHLSYTQQLVYISLVDNPEGLCDKEIQKYIRDNYGVFLPISSINGRRNNLIKFGLVKADDEKIYYPDHNNQMNLQTRWVLTVGGF